MAIREICMQSRAVYLASHKSMSEAEEKRDKVCNEAKEKFEEAKEECDRTCRMAEIEYKEVYNFYCKQIQEASAKALDEIARNVKKNLLIRKILQKKSTPNRKIPLLKIHSIHSRKRTIFLVYGFLEHIMKNFY